MLSYFFRFLAVKREYSLVCNVFHVVQKKKKAKRFHVPTFSRNLQMMRLLLFHARKWLGFRPNSISTGHFTGPHLKVTRAHFLPSNTLNPSKPDPNRVFRWSMISLDHSPSKKTRKRKTVSILMSRLFIFCISNLDLD